MSKDVLGHQNHKSENKNAADSQEEDGNQIQEKNEFIPIRNFETASNFSGSESMTSKESDQRREIIAEQNEKKGNDIDMLPDMSDLQVASGPFGIPRS